MKCVFGAGRGGPVWRRGAVLRRDAEEEQQVCVADSCCGINAEKSGPGRAEEADERFVSSSQTDEDLKSNWGFTSSPVDGLIQNVVLVVNREIKQKFCPAAVVLIKAKVNIRGVNYCSALCPDLKAENECVCVYVLYLSVNSENISLCAWRIIAF